MHRLGQHWCEFWFVSSRRMRYKHNGELVSVSFFWEQSKWSHRSRNLAHCSCFSCTFLALLSWILAIHRNCPTVGSETLIKSAFLSHFDKVCLFWKGFVTHCTGEEHLSTTWSCQISCIYLVSQFPLWPLNEISSGKLRKSSSFACTKHPFKMKTWPYRPTSPHWNDLLARVQTDFLRSTTHNNTHRSTVRCWFVLMVKSLCTYKYHTTQGDLERPQVLISSQVIEESREAQHVGHRERTFANVNWVPCIPV